MKRLKWEPAYISPFVAWCGGGGGARDAGGDADASVAEREKIVRPMTLSGANTVALGRKHKRFVDLAPEGRNWKQNNDFRADHRLKQAGFLSGCGVLVSSLAGEPMRLGGGLSQGGGCKGARFQSSGRSRGLRTPP